MASSTTIDVDDFGGDINDDEMETLNFQDIPHGAPDSPEKGQTTHFTTFPHSAADSDDEADDKEKLIKEEKSGTASFWTFAYYQQFFDVETAQVGQRIVGSMVPKPGSNYLVHQIRPNPDLYGPFWICTTLVFTTAIAGNLANYFSMAGKAYHWQYDFHKVTFAATAIFSYWWLVPLLLWAVLWWRGSQAKFSFLEMLCVYGYSLAIYVPISILWAIQVSWLQWTLVVVGAVLSGSVLLLTFWPAIKEDSQRIAIGLMVFIFIMHAALAAGFVLYFFHVPASASSAPHVTPLPVPVNKTMPAKALPQYKAPASINNRQDTSLNSQSKTAQQDSKAGAGPDGQVLDRGPNAASSVKSANERIPNTGNEQDQGIQAVKVVGGHVSNIGKPSQQQEPGQVANSSDKLRQNQAPNQVGQQQAQPQEKDFSVNQGSQGGQLQGGNLANRGDRPQQQGNAVQRRRSLAGRHRED